MSDFTSDPEITFDEKGICNHCTEFLSRRAKYKYQGKRSDDALDASVRAIKSAGRNARYDCILGVSGGVDSSYLAYIAKRKGLRPLAVHLDNGWNSELAVKNIENIVTRLGFDLYTKVLDWEEFRRLQIALSSKELSYRDRTVSKNLCTLLKSLP